MTSTPRTDAAWKAAFRSTSIDAESIRDFAQILEREGNAASAEIEAMREAIKEAHESLTKANDLLERAGREYETTWEPGQSWIFWEDKCSAKNDVVGIRQTLTKLQPFIKP